MAPSWSSVRAYLQGVGLSARPPPIAPARPGRFYLPCRDTSRGIWQMFGPGRKILYKLPAGMRCRHCVLQWYWATANSCNPAGTKA